MSGVNHSLIMQTAKDYDMDCYDVENIYKKWDSEGLFYQKLEEFIKDRASLSFLRASLRWRSYKVRGEK